MVAALPPDRFLTQLHKMFERTKAAGAVTLTTKRSAFEGMVERLGATGRFFFSLSLALTHAHLSPFPSLRQHEEQAVPQAGRGEGMGERVWE